MKLQTSILAASFVSDRRMTRIRRSEWKQDRTCFLTCVVIEKSPSIMTPRLRTFADGAMSAASMWIGSRLTWCRLLAVAHHKNSVFVGLSRRRLDRINALMSALHLYSAFTRPGLLSLIRAVRDVELRVVRIVVRPEAVSGGS